MSVYCYDRYQGNAVEGFWTLLDNMAICVHCFSSTDILDWYYTGSRFGRLFSSHLKKIGSRGSSVSIVSGYGLDDRAIEVQCS
jgi:hypothetical protein